MLSAGLLLCKAGRPKDLQMRRYFEESTRRVTRRPHTLCVLSLVPPKPNTCGLPVIYG